MDVLVTGAKGFVGRNLCVTLQARDDVELFEYDLDSDPADLDKALRRAGLVFHLAGVNRPLDTGEYHSGNVGFTREILEKLREFGRSPKLVFSSSIQADLDNPYGASKREAENALRVFCEETGAEGVLYRLKNLFGKWSRPHYNSVVATFCHNIARGMPVEITDRSCHIELTYIDDVIASFLGEIQSPSRTGYRFAPPLPSHSIALGDLADAIRFFHDHRNTLQLPDYSDPFMRRLYATYLSALPPEQFSYLLNSRTDERGSLAEFIKSPWSGQLFISRTRPGITRGNHHHHTKTEKFMVVQGRGIIRLRHILLGTVTEIPVGGEEYRVVDIPPGYTHSIENTGVEEMVTLFWSSEIFDPDHPDTVSQPVLSTVSAGGEP